MTNVPIITRTDLPIVSGARELERYLHGAPVSVIFVDSPPGNGPRLHRHPYVETFIVQEPHRFVNSGDVYYARSIFMQTTGS